MSCHLNSFRVFQIGYLFSLAIAIVVGFLWPLYPGWPGIGLMWVIIIFGLLLYLRAYSLTARAAKLEGAVVEKNKAPRDLIVSGHLSRALIIVFSVQAFVGLVATGLYLTQGSFYTMFLGLEVVVLLFGLWDWLNDEMEMRRYLSSHPTV